MWILLLWTLVYMFLCRRIFNSLGCIPRHGIAFNHQTVLPAPAPYFIPTSDVWGCQCCHILVNTCCYLSDDTHLSCPGGCEISAHCDFNLHFPNGCDTEHPFMCLFSGLNIVGYIILQTDDCYPCTNVSCLYWALKLEIALRPASLPYRIGRRKKHHIKACMKCSLWGNMLEESVGREQGYLGRKVQLCYWSQEKKAMEMVLISGEQLCFRHWTKRAGIRTERLGSWLC